MRTPWLSMVIGLIAAGCTSSFNLATERLDYTMISASKEAAMGEKIARQVEKALPLLADVEKQERVRSIGKRLAAFSERQELVYSFAVVEHEKVNAFALPGGYIYIHSGLLEQVESDDELAAVIAHEVGHVSARHSIKRYEGSLGAQLLQLAAIASNQAAGRGVSVAIQSTQLAYARRAELEADRLAIKYLRLAKFDPEAMLTFLKKLDALPERGRRYMPRGMVRPQYALTHPFIPERIRTVKEELYDVADYIDYLNTTP